MRYDFLVDTYATERLKILSAWSEFKDDELGIRPREGDRRGRSVLEQMVHQCQSEDGWFKSMMSIDVNAAIPQHETRLDFIQRYAKDSGKRLEALRKKDDAWWEGSANFFEVSRSRAWIMTRRLTHSSHHRGQLMAMLRMLGHELHSNYGPTADTGGLPKDKAPTIYAYSSLEAVLEGGRKSELPGPGEKPVTERPD
jgi:uncharacterized damage-inducible protein DinB